LVGFGIGFTELLESKGVNMEFQDKTLKCATCGREFFFTAREQEFYHEKNFIEPKHCRECRQQRKLRRETYARGSQAGRDEARPSRSISVVICAECGKPTQVPFKPLTGKPILCRDCFIQKKISSDSKGIPKLQDTSATLETKPPEIASEVDKSEITKSVEPEILPDTTISNADDSISQGVDESLQKTEPTEEATKEPPLSDIEDTSTPEGQNGVEPKE
jgi:CxxC-x17-CxxC domain-containing protein